MKNTFVSITILVLAFTASGCSKEKYNLIPGEVQLKSTKYTNDDKMSYDALAVWHAIIIQAQHDFEFQNFDYKNTDSNTRNTYKSPTEAEEAFDRCIENSFSNAQDKYKDLIYEIVNAQPQAASEYVWCSATDEFTTLKFVFEPTLAE